MYNIVQKSVFGSSFLRLDAEYVERTAVEYEQALEKVLGGLRLSFLAVDYKEDDKQFIDERSEEQLEDVLPIRYISIDSVDTADGLSFDTEYSTIDALPSRARYLVEPSDILVSNVRPNRGAVALIRQDQAGLIASSGFTLVKVDAQLPKPDKPEPKKLKSA